MYVLGMYLDGKPKAMAVKLYQSCNSEFRYTFLSFIHVHARIVLCTVAHQHLFCLDNQNSHGCQCEEEKSFKQGIL